MRRQSRGISLVIGILVILSMVLSACAVPTAPAAAPAAPAAGAAPAAAAPAIDIPNADWWAKAAEPYKGSTIRGVSESTPPSRFSQEVLAPLFTKLTGINVEFETTSWDAMYDKEIKDMAAGTGTYDFDYIEQDIIYTYLAKDYLTDLTKLMADKPDLKSPTFDITAFTSFIDNFKGTDGDLYGVPMESFLKIYLYRTDLFNDPKIQEAFKAAYGYDLAPATTHQQYKDIADFFTKWGVDNKMELWGTTNTLHTEHASSTYESLESVMPTFGVYNWGINMDTWKACVANGGEMNSPKSVEALQYRLDLMKDSPPESTQSTWDEVAATFAAGRAAQGIIYGENAAWIATNPDKSTVLGNVGVAMPPLEPGVLDDAKSGKGYVGYYDGGAFGVPVSSKNKEAALLWLEFIGQPVVQGPWAKAGSRITLTSTFDDPIVQALNPLTDNYFGKMKDWGPLFKGAPAFPFHNQVRGEMDPFFWSAFAGTATAQEALDGACAAAEKKMVEMGYGK